MRDMETIELHIADFRLTLQLERVRSRLSKETAYRFQPFVKSNGRQPNEIMQVLSIKPLRKGHAQSPWTILIQECMERPLKKFPFENNYQQDHVVLFQKIKGY